MKQFLQASVGLVALALAAPAVAADLKARPYYTKAPAPVAAVYDWSGLYIGVNGGWGSSRKCWTDTSPFFGGPEGCHNATGGLAGARIGYRFQAGAFVFGVEAQGDWAKLRGLNVSEQAFFFGNFTNRSHIGAFGLFTGQVGYAFNTLLLYVKGGAALASDGFDIVSTTGNVLAGFTPTQNRWGSTVGTGIEFSFAPNWSAALEYDHLFLGTKDARFTDATFGILFSNDRMSQDADLVTVRVNYRFGLNPVVAKY